MIDICASALTPAGAAADPLIGGLLGLLGCLAIGLVASALRHLAGRRYRRLSPGASAPAPIDA